MHYIKKAIIRSAIGFGISLFVVIMALIFLHSKISDAALQVSTLREQLVLREVSAKSLAALHEQYETTITNYEAILKGYIPRRDDLVNVAKDLADEAVRSGVTGVITLSGEVPPAPPNFGYITLSVSVTGPTKNVRAYFDNLERFRFLNLREGMTFRETDTGLEAATKIKVYYQTL